MKQKLRSIIYLKLTLVIMMTQTAINDGCHSQLILLYLDKYFNIDGYDKPIKI